jgi:hypothetical protein
MPKVQPLVPALHLNLLRAGGCNNDANKSSGAYGTDPFGQSQIDTFVAYARAVGAEPMIQVPLIDNYKQHGGTVANPADAAAMVTNANITMRYGVKYWEIGNEPDLYSGADLPGYTIDRYIADFKAFSAAMKAVDPSIQLLGPELSWKYFPNQAKNSADDWLTPFIVQAKGAYDIIAIHRYPFAASDCTLPAAMGDVGTFVSLVQAIQGLIADSAPGTPFAITEANITWDGDPSHGGSPASPPTLNAGIWVADILAAARELGLWSLHFWSLAEGWTLGFIDASTANPQPRPEYYAMKLVTDNMGPKELTATAPAGFSVYASRSAAEDATVVLVLNKHATSDAETFTFSGMSGTPAQGFQATFPAYSISAVIFPDGGGSPTIYRYLEVEVAAGTGPTRVQ